MFAITALIGTTAVTLFVFQVMIVVSDREGSEKPGEAWDEARDGTVETFESVGNVIATGLSVGSNIAGVITVVIVFIFFGLLFLTALGIGIANFGDEASSAFDSAFTEVWSPFYRTVVLGIADPLLSIWNIILPVSNSLNGSWRILRSNAIQQGADCQEVDWGDVALKLRDTILSTFGSIVTWTLGLAYDEFDLYTPLRDLQQAIEIIMPVVSCWCEATTLVNNIVTDTVVSHELAAVIDQSLNLILNIIKDILGGLVQLFKAFGVAIFSDDFFVALADYYWEPNRAPTIDRTLRSIGELIARLADWLDDIVVSLGVNLFSLSTSEVPRLFGIVGNYAQSLVLFWNVFYDALLKPLRYMLQIGTRYDDAAWDESRPVGLRSQALLTDAFVKAYNASELSETFFQTLTVPLQALNDSIAAADAQELLNLTGCMSHELLDVATSILEMFLRAAAATFHERLLGGEYGEFIRSSPFSDAIDVALTSSERFAACAGGFVSVLNDPLGVQVNETGHVIVAIIQPFVALHEHWNNRSFFWNSTLYSDLVDNVFVELDAYAIANGNFWRQFAFINSTTIDPDVECRMRDPHLEQFPVGTAPDMGDWEDFYPWYVDPFCCLGGAAEEFLRLLFGLIEGITRSIVTFVAEPTLGDGFVESFKTGGPLDLRVEFLPMVDFLLRDLFQFSCIRNGVVRAIAEAYFGGPSVPCGAGTNTFWEELTEVTTGMIRVPIRVVVGGAAEIWSWIVDLVDGAPCGAVCWCSRLKALYATTGGTIVDWMVDIMEFIGCLFDSGGQVLDKLVQWAGTLRDIAGSEGTLATGDFFCVIADFFETIWDLFKCWGEGSEGSGFIGCLFDTILASFEELILAVVDCLKNAWSELKEVIICIPNSLWNWIEAFFGDYTCLWDSDNPCPKLEVYMKNCKFVIPAECGPGSLGLTTGEVGFTFDDLPTETYTRVISNCDNLPYLSEAWFACIASATNTETATLTRYVEYSNIVKKVQKISDVDGGFSTPLTAGDEFGRASSCVGDLNGDDVMDIAVGAPLTNDGSGAGRGAVFILFMKTDGTVLGEAMISDSFGGFTATLDNDDQFGSAVASLGDLNADGSTDLAVGARFDDDGGTDRGAVYILFMSIAVVGEVDSFQKISDTAGNFGGVLDNEDYFGFSVEVIGDLDGDGVVDLAVGAPLDDSSGPTVNSGAVWILFLEANGTVGAFQKISPDDGGFSGALGPSDDFGYDIARLGDVNSDGVEDLAVGAIGDGGPNRGAVWILFMNPDGTVNDVSGGRKINTASVGFEGALNDGDWFGFSVAGLGDFDHDGIMDLAVGSARGNDGGSNKGSVYIIFLLATGGVREFTEISETQGGFPINLDLAGEFGSSVSVIGDLDGDSVVDIVVGAHFDDAGGVDKGALYVIFLGAEVARIRKSGDMVHNEEKISDTVGGFTGVLDNGDWFGRSLAWLGDLDGDGGMELAVGAPRDDNGGVPQFLPDEYGAVWILSLDPSSHTVKSHQKLSNSSGGLVWGPTITDQYGRSVTAVGDLDGDNITDLAVGANLDTDGGSARGAVWIVFLNANGTSRGEQKISDTQGNFSGVLEFLDNFGTSLASLGDLDGDNITDLAVGAPGDGDGGAGRGAVYILFLHRNGTVKNEAKLSHLTSGISLSNNDEFGSSIAAILDLNGDGIVDLAVGARNDDDGDTDQGSVSIIMLDTDGSVKTLQKISATDGGFAGVMYRTPFYGFGRAVASAGDLDGDGVSDLVVGSGADDDGGSNRGAAWFLFLRTDGTVKSHKKVSYYEGGFLGSTYNFDEFGDSLAFIGDLDGDGVSELAVGAALDDDGSLNPEANRGAVWILYLNEVVRDELVESHQEISTLEGNFTGSLDAFDGFGYAVAVVGDLDGDNVTELIVGAPQDADGGTDRGALWILFTTSNGTAASVQKISSTAGNFTGTLDDGDMFGASVAAIGDLDGDGIPDVVTGAYADDDGGTDRGAAWVLFLNANGTVASHQKISDLEGDFTGVLIDGDFFGFSVASLGDLDGDNVTDLAVGAWSDDDGGASSGAVWIIFLRPNGTASGHQKISSTDGDFTGGLQAGDMFGLAVSALGDLDLDGTLDMLVGAVGNGLVGPRTGAVWVIFLNANGTVKAHQQISGVVGGFEGDLDFNARFGGALAVVGDMDGDGIPDIAVGNPEDDGGQNRGSVWILLMLRDGTVKGSLGGLPFQHGVCDVAESEFKIGYTSGGFIGPLTGASDLFGSSLAPLGDFDGDGVFDFVVGSSGYNGEGAVWMLFMNDMSPLSKKRARPQRGLVEMPMRPKKLTPEALREVHRKRLGTIATTPSTISDTLYGLPETIEFEDIERWCLIEGSHLGSLQEAMAINTNSTQISSDQKDINQRLINASVYEMGMSYRGCLASAAVSKIVDIGIGFVSKNETLVPPKTFYDPFLFLHFASRVLYVVPVVFEYHFERVTQAPTTLTGGDFAYFFETQHNVTDRLTMNLGLFGDRMIRAARMLVYNNKANIVGYLVNTFGELMYQPAQFDGIAGNKKRLIYGSAPLHPKGWQSSAWTEFRDRYAGGLSSGYSEWTRAAGFENRLWTLEYLSDIPSMYRRRIEWNKAGRDPETEPPPRGRLAQRARYANLLEREYAPRHVWESNDTAEVRSTYARAVRRARYPSLEIEHETMDQNLIFDSIVCPVGVGGASNNCTVRSCWSSDGASVGVCAHRSDIFGRPLCSCDYDSTGGACCGDTSCTDVDSAANCAADSVFAPNRTCAMSTTCAAARGACCAQNGTCATVSLPERCTGNSTFLVGSGCSACADVDLIVGACCDSGTCTMTTEAACVGTWNSHRNCSSRALSSECRHCGIAPCLSCDLLSATVNDIVDLWILNMELINKSAASGACCHGGSATNRSCVVSARSTCDDLPSSTWFWGEQCTFCQTPFAFEMLAQTPPRTVRPLNFERDLDRVVLDTFETLINFFLEQGARIFPSLEGKTFDVDAFVENVSKFFFSNDGEDPGSWRFWFDFLLRCDVFDHLFPDVGPQGLGIVSGLFWATIILSLVYAILFRCWSFLGGLLSGVILVLIWFMLVLIIAYFYSPACYSPAIIPRYVLRGRTGSPQAQADSSPVAGAGAAVPAVGGRIAKATSRTAAGLARAKTFLKSAARQALLFMFSVPMIPVQLGQDVRDDILARFDVECLPLCDVACPREHGKWPCAWMTDADRENGIECLDAPDCCAVAECPEERVFPACALEPYNFRGSTREFAYWARVLAPRWNCFFLHSDFFLFAWIRQVPGVAEKLDFPGDECDAPDFDDARWRYCGTSNILLLAPWLILLLMFYIFFAALVILAWVIFKASAKFALRITSFWTAASRNAVRTTAEPKPPPAEKKMRRKEREAAHGEDRVVGHSRHRASLKKE